LGQRRRLPQGAAAALERNPMTDFVDKELL
jgi:hypothetical protein